MLDDGSSIGVGITTRNRAPLLRLALAHYERTSARVDKYVVVDDCSPPDVLVEVEQIVAESPLPIILRSSRQRLGVSKAKNACLAGLQDVDHVFLSDDDAWPIQSGWEQWWIDASAAGNASHTMWIPDCTNYDVVGLHVLLSSHHPVQQLNRISSFSNCLGVFLYFSRKALDALGGFDCRMPNPYGYEHAQLSKRAYRLGLTGGAEYTAPDHCEDWIFSRDMSHIWMRQPVDSLDMEEPPLTSSVSAEDVGGIELNSPFMTTDDLYIQLVDPL